MIFMIIKLNYIKDATNNWRERYYVNPVNNLIEINQTWVKNIGLEKDNDNRQIKSCSR
jgi:hypothetical protein